MAFRGKLVSEVLKGATTVEVEPLGAYENFSATGGDAYIKFDKFTYTGYTLGTESFTLTGCANIDFSHDAGSDIDSHYGARFRDLMPVALKSESNDPDGVLSVIAYLLEKEVFKPIKDGLIDVHRNIDPTRCDAMFLPLICGNNGLESNTDVDEDTLRSLARQAAAVLSYRGSLNAFKFMVWHTLGYQVDVDINRAQVNAIWANRNHRWYTPPTEMAVNDRTVAYWKFTEGSGTSVANEVSGGTSLTLANAAMWNSDCMFRKAESIEIDAVNTYAESSATAISTGNIHGKSSWSIKLLIKPATGGATPQTLLYKGSTIVVTRPNATDINVSMSDGITTVNHTFEDCVTENTWDYLSIVFNRPTMSVVMDGEVIGSSILFDLDTVDMGDPWIIGDKTGVQPFLGKVDTVMISTGYEYLVESIRYYEHIDILRSFGTDTDRNVYWYDLDENDNFVTIVILNGDGDPDKREFLQYLIEEWLTLSNYTIVDVAHLPIEMQLGMWL